LAGKGLEAMEQDVEKMKQRAIWGIDIRLICSFFSQIKVKIHMNFDFGIFRTKKKNIDLEEDNIFNKSTNEYTHKPIKSIR
jgi:hypothetical protein